MAFTKLSALAAAAALVSVVAATEADLAAPADRQYTYDGSSSAPAATARSGCRTVSEKCGSDCKTEKKCVQHGCHKEAAYKCSKDVTEKYDCHLERSFACKKKEFKSYDCDKWVTKFVHDGCEKQVTKTFGCHKDEHTTCQKERIVSVQCDRKEQVPCKKSYDAKCSKWVAKTCHKTEHKSEPCTKTYKKEVNCAHGGHYGYDGKPCFETIAYPSTCTKDVTVDYDCGYNEEYTCQKEYDATCEKIVVGLCKKTETYSTPCTKQVWKHDGCSHQVTEKFGCDKSIKVVGTCSHEVEVDATCHEKKWVHGGCSKTVHKDALCKKSTWDSNCCAKTEDVHTCTDKMCDKKVCGRYY